MKMKKSVIAAVVLVTLLSGCLTLFQQTPRYVEGTNLEIRTNDRGEDYIARIGESKTTVVEAILSGNGYYSISYTYSDTEWLLIDRLIIETSCCINSVDSREPLRVDDGEGTVTETDSIEVRRNLFEQILESENPVIFIEGEQGTVIIEIGAASKRNLQELLEYGDKRFPGKG